MVLACDGLWNALPEQQASGVPFTPHDLMLSRVRLVDKDQVDAGLCPDSGRAEGGKRRFADHS
jgi:hypothetical protein